MIDPKLLDAVSNLVTTVGQYQSQCFRSLSTIGGQEKEAREFVSEVDLNSEEMLITGLQKLLPDAGFYGEETGIHGNTTLRWVIDPLDGTTNFLSGLDQFSISVALEQEEKTILGIVYRPQSQESYTALSGRGLYHNGQPWIPAKTDSLKQALIGTGFPYRSQDLSKHFFPCAEEVLYRCRGIRRFGSGALDLSYVAAGFLQGFWESDLQPYDVASALLFLEESGQIITNQRGEQYSPYRDRMMVCGSQAVHEELLKIVAHHYPKDL